MDLMIVFDNAAEYNCYMLHCGTYLLIHVKITTFQCRHTAAYTLVLLGEKSHIYLQKYFGKNKEIIFCCGRPKYFRRLPKMTITLCQNVTADILVRTIK
jgi:hypothetical protein